MYDQSFKLKIYFFFLFAMIFSMISCGLYQKQLQESDWQRIRSAYKVPETSGVTNKSVMVILNTEYLKKITKIDGVALDPNKIVESVILSPGQHILTTKYEETFYGVSSGDTYLKLTMEIDIQINVLDQHSYVIAATTSFSSSELKQMDSQRRLFGSRITVPMDKFNIFIDDITEPESVLSKYLEVGADDFPRKRILLKALFYSSPINSSSYYFWSGETINLERDESHIDDPSAIDAYSKAIEKKPGFWFARYKRGIAYYRDAQYKKAVSDFQDVLKEKPDYSGAYLYLGYVYRAIFNKEESIKNFSLSAKLGNPDAIKMMENLNYNDLYQAISKYPKTYNRKGGRFNLYLSMDRMNFSGVSNQPVALINAGVGYNFIDYLGASIEGGFLDNGEDYLIGFVLKGYLPFGRKVSLSAGWGIFSLNIKETSAFDASSATINKFLLGGDYFVSKNCSLSLNAGYMLGKVDISTKSQFDIFTGHSVPSSLFTRDYGSLFFSGSIKGYF